MEEPLLQYRQVEVCFGHRPVIHNVSFSLGSGEILGIAGESGSGKSTLLKAAVGLLENGGRVTQGAIRFGGKNLPDLGEKDMAAIRGRGLSMIFQDPQSFWCPVRTMGSQICESLDARGKKARAQAREQALDLFQRLHLENGQRIWNSYPFELSGGMNQRVSIAMAMLMKPPVLLADEPTSALDSQGRKQVIRQILQLRQLFGTAVLLVTHQIGLLSAVADNILVLKEGRIVEYGKASQVLCAPQHPYTKQLLDAMPKIQM